MGCRARATAADLLRVVVSVDVIVPDPAHRLPGRGAYLHLDAQCHRNAVRRKAWMRALRLVAPLPDDAVAVHLAEVVGDWPASDTAGPGGTAGRRNAAPK
ncbi:MAG: YlxR family protein [Nakamurella sp.]